MRSSAFIILLVMLICGETAFAQSTTNSPYSKYGIGVIRPQTFGPSFGMGGIGIGLRSNRNINLLNPASYSAIGVTTFDVGYTNNALWLDDGSETQYQNNPFIDHISFGIPMIKKVWGMSFGFLPYSNIGYKYDEIIADPTAGDISFYSEGEGAINKAYFGNGVGFNLKTNADPFSLILKAFNRSEKRKLDSITGNMKKHEIKIDSVTSFSFGANAYFLFGSMSHDQKIIYGDIPGSYNVWTTRDYSVSDFGFDFGFQYQKGFTRKNNITKEEEQYQITFGATYGLAADLSATRTEIVRTFVGNVEFGTVKDTSELIDGADHLVQLPSQLGFGLSFEKIDKWIIGVDYKSANWGTIASNDNLFDYKSNYSVAAGIQFIPKYDGAKYMERLAYRVGVRFSDSYLVINDIDWSEYGITFGIGLPVRKSESSYPRVNFGFEYGNRGTTESGLITEKFFNFNIGVTINSVWFRKRKYD